MHPFSKVTDILTSLPSPAEQFLRATESQPPRLWSSVRHWINSTYLVHFFPVDNYKRPNALLLAFLDAHCCHENKSQLVSVWLERAVRSECESKNLGLSNRATLPSGTGWMESRVWTPSLVPAGWGGQGTPALHADIAEQSSAHLPVTLWSDDSASSKPCSGWLWSHLVPLGGLTWHSIAQVNPGPPWLCSLSPTSALCPCHWV